LKDRFKVGKGRRDVSCLELRRTLLASGPCKKIKINQTAVSQEKRQREKTEKMANIETKTKQIAIHLRKLFFGTRCDVGQEPLEEKRGKGVERTRKGQKERIRTR